MHLADRLTYSRFLFGSLALIFALRHDIILFSIFYLIAVITDILDGYFARKYKTDSKKGKVLDIIADNFLVICVFIGLYFLGKLTHIVLFSLLFGYYIFIQLLSLIIKKKLIFMRNISANLAAIAFPLMIFSMLFFDADIIIKIYAFLMLFSLTEKLAIRLDKKWIWLIFIALIFVAMQLRPKACFDRCLNIEIKDTPIERSLGLMYRESLAKNEAMLFLFEKPETQQFWMKNMQIPIDMIFISDEYYVVKVYSDVPPCKDDPCEIYSADEVRYVLETNANYSKENNISIGKKVKLLI